MIKILLLVVTLIHMKFKFAYAAVCLSHSQAVGRHAVSRRQYSLTVK